MNFAWKRRARAASRRVASRRWDSRHEENSTLSVAGSAGRKSISDATFAPSNHSPLSAAACAGSYPRARTFYKYALACCHERANPLYVALSPLPLFLSCPLPLSALSNSEFHFPNSVYLVRPRKRHLIPGQPSPRTLI